VYAGLVDKLTENGAKGVVANFILLHYTYFTTVPHNPVPLTAGSEPVNDGYAQYNGDYSIWYL
jgi:hypothetical protein